MTLKYEILKKLVKIINIKKRFSAASVEELLAEKRKGNAKKKLPNLKDKDFHITWLDVLGFPVMKMSHRKPVEKACLYVIGTGMITAPGKGAFKKALKLAKETGMDMYVPCYPLCTEYPLKKAYQMIHETYKKMLLSYQAENITVFGFSSGGNLALGMVSYINDGHQDVLMPGKIVLSSPGTCVDGEEEWQRMLALDEKDLVVPASYMKIAEEIMRHGDDQIPDYMLWLQRGIYTNCPKVVLMYGGDETLYACAPAIETVLKKYGVDYQLIVGEGLFHCYPVFPLCKEAKDGWKSLVNIMKE